MTAYHSIIPSKNRFAKNERKAVIAFLHGREFTMATPNSFFDTPKK